MRVRKIFCNILQQGIVMNMNSLLYQFLVR